MGSYYGFFGLIYSFIRKRYSGILTLFAAPFIWVSIEYIRSNMSFLSFPWALLGHSQYRYPSIIQLASFTGAYGVSFLIVMANVVLALVIREFLYQLKLYKAPYLRNFSTREMIAIALFPSILIALALLYGKITIDKPIIGKEIKVALVQGNIDQAKKWDRRYASFIMQTYADLTREAAKDGPELIIWPETATPGSISRHPRLNAQVKLIAREASACLLLGSSQHRKFGERRATQLKYVNSAHLICPASGMAQNQRYDKIRLVPFGEYMPLKGIFPWSFFNVPNIDYYVPGKELTIFEILPFKFSTTICWENIFPDLVRRFVKGGAQFIVNITNEAWFGKTAAPYQFVSMSVFRAVENRIFVIRCANSGISCFIDPYGRVIDRIKDKKGQDIFIQGVMSGLIIPLESKTFYTRYGDWLAWLSILCSVVFFIVAFLKNNQDSHSMHNSN